MFLRILLPLFLPDLHLEFKVKEILHTLETPGLLVSSGMFDEMAGNQVCYHMLSFNIMMQSDHNFTKQAMYL